MSFSPPLEFDLLNRRGVDLRELPPEVGGGAVDQVLQAALQGDVLLLVDSRMLAEYDEVTAGPTFGLVETERRALLDAIERIAEPVVAATMRLTPPDTDDQKVGEVALAGRAVAMVTGNTRHLMPRKGRLGITIMTPRQLVDRVRT